MTYHAISYKEITFTFIRDVTNFYGGITQNLIGNYVASPVCLHSAVPHFLIGSGFITRFGWRLYV
ncbi:MAG: hypothetical protein PHX50_17180 [Massilibacteroides sp.]|nr:hypothetical protein [Massilibacteroides sp.]